MTVDQFLSSKRLGATHDEFYRQHFIFGIKLYLMWDLPEFPPFHHAQPSIAAALVKLALIRKTFPHFRSGDGK